MGAHKTLHYLGVEHKGPFMKQSTFSEWKEATISEWNLRTSFPQKPSRSMPALVATLPAPEKEIPYLARFFPRIDRATGFPS